MRTLMWFRADLRTTDNPALYHAAAASNEVLAVFCLSPGQWQEHDWADIKVAFLMRNLRELRAKLESLNIALHVIEADTFDDVPEAILTLCEEHSCEAVYCNREYEINERRRDEAVESKLAERGIAMHQFHDQVFAAPGTIRTSDDRFYSVYSPFRKALSVHLEETSVRDALDPRPLDTMCGKGSGIPTDIKGFDLDCDNDELWPGGEDHARKRLERFVKNRAAHYKDMRDLAAEDATSRLSPYLALGVISPHECLRAAMRANGGKLRNGAKGLDAWISELIWREFYRHILVGYPRVSMAQPFKTNTRNIRWNSNDQHLAAWKEGETGFPIVDAGMRQLQAEGWMHNRLRMVTAMFLSKDLLLDWRLGERHFMRHLIDGDLASNNGGWQWSASTGTDAAPYFRIFNPTSQSTKADPDGVYIRRYVRELADVTGKAIHDPPSDLRKKLGYPEPIVDHKVTREAAIEAFKNL